MGKRCTSTNPEPESEEEEEEEEEGDGEEAGTPRAGLASLREDSDVSNREASVPPEPEGVPAPNEEVVRPAAEEIPESAAILSPPSPPPSRHS
jgi:hypothetical protein